MIVQVAPGLHRVSEVADGRELAVFVCVGDEAVVVVDAGLAATPARTIEPALQALGVPRGEPLTILVTHADSDHSGGVAGLCAAHPGSRIACHPADRPLIEDVDALLDRRYREFRVLDALDQSPSFVSWVRRNTRGVRVHAEVVDGDTIELGGGRRLRVLHTPGHSDGHISLVDSASGAAVVADAVLGDRALSSAGAGTFAPTYRRVAAYRETIRRLRPLAAGMLLTSHFPPFHGGAAASCLDLSAAFADRLEAAVLQALAGGKPLTTAQVLGRAAAAVRGWPEEADASLAYAVVGHLEDLAARALVEPAAGSPRRWRRAGGGATVR